MERGKHPNPLDDFWDATQALEDAKRHGTSQDQEVARQGVVDARERCGAMGAFLFLLGIDLHYDLMRPAITKELRELVEPVWERACLALRLAQDAQRQTDALRQRVIALERRLDDLTPSVGAPEWDAIQVSQFAKRILDQGMRISKLERIAKGL